MPNNLSKTAISIQDITLIETEYLSHKAGLIRQNSLTSRYKAATTKNERTGHLSSEFKETKHFSDSEWVEKQQQLQVERTLSPVVGFLICFHYNAI